MTRGRYLFLYFCLLCAVLACGGLVLLALGPAASAVIVFPVWGGLLLVMFIPEFIQRILLIDLRAGHRLINSQPDVSVVHSRRFLTRLSAQPWLKHVIWLGTSHHSHNIEAIARNNLGGALMGVGDLDTARSELERSIALDPRYHLPYKNMGQLLLRSARFQDALPWWKKAKALGMKDSWIDWVVEAAEYRNALPIGERATSQIEAGRRAPAEETPGTFVVEIQNDNKTPFVFVVSMLEDVFALPGLESIRITQRVDARGRAVCAAFATETEAEGRATQVMAMARENDHPLTCIVRPATTAGPYPDGIDFIWIARDAQGRVGAFVTAGEGPVPETAFGRKVDVEDIADLLRDMPETGEAHLLASMPDPSSFLALARCGFHVFDWDDLHRTYQASTDHYQIRARPVVELMADALPEALHAALVALPASDFAWEEAIAPHHQLPCRRPARG